MGLLKRFIEMLFGECGEPSAATFSQMKYMASTLDDDEKINQMWQASEDLQFQRDVNNMAIDMYMQWLKGGEYGIIIPSSPRVIYTIHDETTARFKNISIFEMAKPIFEQLKNSHDVTKKS